MTDTEREQRVLQLLRSLDEWERSSKSTAGRSLKSTGESNARIATLEAELVQLGAQYRRKAGAFELVGLTKPGSGERLPDP
jgi:hypothetical protein